MAIDEAGLPHAVVAGVRPGQTLLVTAGVHGDEYEGMAAIRALRRRVDPGLLRGRLVLAPVVNDGAFRAGARVAADGLDLARVCPGRADGGPTERAAFAVSRMIAASDAYVDLHSGGAGLRVLPLCGYALVRDPGILATQRRMAAAFGLPFVWGTTASLDGRTLSVARDAGVPAVYAEWGGGGCDPAGVDAYIAGCLGVMRALGMLPSDTPAAPRADALVVEDDRPGAGHLQAGHPAPTDGFFTALVGLGDRVRRGQAIGLISDGLGDREQAVSAACDGIVAVLRAQPRVRVGDALAVVVEAPGASS
ncbi:MAG TPA: succinylglutamate desuccinylase/aspartoacylase family protein [Planctomycetota bacterium]|nr:succinylglutamate desuccinylase/aspartoacylase family protein [Planctomycetota bacterium]